MHIYNVENLKYIKIYRKRKYKLYKIVEKIRWSFPITFIKEKVVKNVISGKFFKLNDFSEENLYIENDKIYHKPHIEFYYDKSDTTVFLSNEEIDKVITWIRRNKPNFLVIETT